MKNFSVILAAMAILTAAVSCGKIGGDNNEDNPRKQLELDTKSTELLQKGNTFAFEFLSRIDAAKEGKDYIVSPLSMQFLLGMTLNGAQGATADEIAKVLGYSAADVDAMNEYCQAMLKQLPGLDRKTRLSIADAFAVNGSFLYKASFREAMRTYYDAEIFELTYDGGVGQINKWCSDHTNGMIPKIIDAVPPRTAAYLLNAMYFKSLWHEKFPKGNTALEAFTSTSGVVKQVSMMKNKSGLDYQENDVFRAVKLPYGNGAFSMTVILPVDGKTLADVTGALDAESWRAFEVSMVGCNVDLWLPRFETRSHFEFKDLLSEMGMPSAFTKDADFSGITRGFFLSDINQDTVIKVDEEGTEAAVVSHASGEVMAMPPGAEVVFHADQPFLYLITEKSSGAVLFAGRYSGE